jgi:hypothetical protein
MSYNEIRSKIKSGDLVFLKAAGIGKAITAITGGTYSHCGIAVWLHDEYTERLMLIEAFEGGRRVVSLSCYANRQFIVLDSELNYSAISSEALDNTGKVGYGYFDFIKIGIRDLLMRHGIAPVFRDSPGEVCSEFVAKMLKLDNKLPYGVDTLIDPSMLFETIRPFCSVVATNE